MSEIKDIIGAVSESNAEIVKEVYSDVAKPVVQPTGEIAGLIPRAVKAALAPLEKWILLREYNIAETKKLLEIKLENVSPELIEPPEAYVAIPAIQNLSYCMDNEELRDMYANLLANSMNKVVKNGVHPGFVEIIKQLSPDEAKILKLMAKKNTVPTVSLRYERENNEGIEVVSNYSDIGEQVDCEYPNKISTYFDNLLRLGLVRKADLYSSLVDKDVYKPLKESHFIVSNQNEEIIKGAGFHRARIIESFMSITDFGESFCEICL